MSGMRVFINKNDTSENNSNFSWGLADSIGNPILSSVMSFSSETEVQDAINKCFKDWSLEVHGSWKEK
tara:strand:+ start:1353 stop:1556 length:204 start_codon:yes stop_codon:yes gene_type:complete